MKLEANYYSRHVYPLPETPQTSPVTSALEEVEAHEPLVDAQRLLEILFDEESRPTLRWVRQMQTQRKIPYYKIGRLVRFRVSEVESALSQKCHVSAS